MDLPLDREHIEAAARPFGSSLGLPGAAYTSQDVFDWERENFFEPSWWCVGRAPAEGLRQGDRDLHGWAFVQRETSGPPFETQFGNLADHLRLFDPGSLVVGASRS